MSVRSLSLHTVNIQSQTQTADAGGSFVTAWTARYTSMPCRIVPMSGEQQAIYNKDNTAATHIMFVPTPATYSGIVENDRVLYGSRVFHIELVRNIDEMNHHLEVILRELKDGF